MKRSTIATSIAVSVMAAFSPCVRANPIPWPPPAAMPVEEMTVVILQTDEGLDAAFTGEFTFTYIPSPPPPGFAGFGPGVERILFPVPPDAHDIHVWQDDVELSWSWSDERYPTVLPEMPTIPMIEWAGPFQEEGAVC